MMLSFWLFFFFLVIINICTYYQIAHYSYYLWYPQRMSPGVSSLMKSKNKPFFRVCMETVGLPNVLKVVS